MYATCHYAVFPYKMMSQSGAVKVAMNYNKPVIVSNLPGFKDEVVEGVNGLFFHSEDIESLKQVMKRCIDMPEVEYAAFEKRTANYVAQHLSIDSIINQYKAMIDKII